MDHQSNHLYYCTYKYVTIIHSHNLNWIHCKLLPKYYKHPANGSHPRDIHLSYGAVFSLYIANKVMMSVDAMSATICRLKSRTLLARIQKTQIEYNPVELQEYSPCHDFVVVGIYCMTPSSHPLTSLWVSLRLSNAGDEASMNELWKWRKSRRLTGRSMNMHEFKPDGFISNFR